MSPLHDDQYHHVLIGHWIVNGLKGTLRGVFNKRATSRQFVLFCDIEVLAHISCRPRDRYKECLLNRNNNPVARSNFSAVLLGIVTCTKCEPEPTSTVEMGTDIVRTTRDGGPRVDVPPENHLNGLYRLPGRGSEIIVKDRRKAERREIHIQDFRLDKSERVMIDQNLRI